MKPAAAVHGRTLRGRVSLVATVTIAAWLILLVVGLNVIVGRRLDSQVDNTLRVRAQAVSTIVEISDGSLVGVSESATDSELDSGVWVFAGRRVVAAPHTTRAAADTAAELATTAGGFSSRHDLRFFVLPLTNERQRIGTVVAALDTGPYSQTEYLVAFASSAVALLVLAGAYPILRLAAKRSLRPMTAMSDQAATWSVHSPGQRFGSSQRFSELRELAGSLDELLDRVSALMRYERQLNAELSHELRTPLTRITTEAELALGGHQSHDDALRAIRDDCADMEGIIETLLATARVENLSVVTHTAVDSVLAGFATSTDVRPVVSNVPSDLSVGVGKDVVVRILTPIVENAHRYATSVVALDAHRDELSVVIRVANDGPCIPAGELERILEPGYRGTDAVATHSGAGLGLALAHRLALAADGWINVASSDSWTTFEIGLPAG